MTKDQEAEIEACAQYLDELEKNMLRNDADMMMDKSDAPSEWAERLRKLTRPLF